MSTTSTVFSDERPAVLVRAYRSEPVKLRALADHGETIEVFGNKEDTTLSLRATSVFQFDESLFGRLRRAFESCDEKKLEKLWEEARRFQNMA